MSIAVVVILVAAVIWVSTKLKDEQIRARGGRTDAPAWARWLFVVFFTGLTLLGLAGLAGIGAAFAPR